MAREPIKAPDSDLMSEMSTPVPYTDQQLLKGISRSEVVDNQTENNSLWDEDRYKLQGLQKYIRTLQSRGIISE